MEEKMNAAGALVAPLLSTNPGVGLKTCPVGSEGEPGRVTRTVGTLAAVVLPGAEVYSVAVSVPLLADHRGVVGPRARPQGLTRSRSTSAAPTVGRSETRLTWLTARSSPRRWSPWGSWSLRSARPAPGVATTRPPARVRAARR